MNSITQDMKFRQSLLQYADKYGVARASRKYNKTRSYIYFWRKRYDGTISSLACHSRKPHHHPREHTSEELKLIRDMHRRNPRIGLVDLWCRLRKRGYTHCIESLYRVMRREGMTADKKVKKKQMSKPYETIPKRNYFVIPSKLECNFDFVNRAFAIMLMNLCSAGKEIVRSCR